MRIGSLFSGYGGLEMGVQSALGGTVAWHCEFDANPSKILAHHHPEVPNYGDITTVDWTQVEPVEILTAGYPCQPFSHAGQRKGTNDDRHLWPHVVEAMSVLRPKMALFENVQGHLTLGFDQVLRDLNLLGYTAKWVLISAASVGAPHRRNRLFIFAEDNRGHVCSRIDRRRGVYRYPGSRRVLSGQAESVNVGQGIAGAAEDGAGVRREGGAGPARDGRSPGVVDVAADRPGSCTCDRGSAPAPAGEGRACGHRYGVPGDGGRLAAPAERAGDLDDGHAGACFCVPGTDSGSEPSWTGPGAAGTSRWATGGGVPVGSLVGAGGRPVRAGGVHGPDADARLDGGGSRLLDPRTGAVDVPLLPSPRTSDTNGAGHHGQGGMDLRTAVSLLPTPAVNDMGAGKTVEAWDEWTAKMKSAHGNGNGHGASLSIEALRMLPTPRAGDGEKGGPNQRGSSGDLMLPSAVMQLLPTPRASDGPDATSHGRSWSTTDRNLHTVARLGQFGDYTPAIARWETVLGRPAPAPTEPTGKAGAHRLSPAFVEWLMGLPAGHVTDVPDLNRNAQLKALGNGVVPQQAAAALTHLLTIHAQEMAA